MAESYQQVYEQLESDKKQKFAASKSLLQSLSQRCEQIINLCNKYHGLIFTPDKGSELSTCNAQLFELYHILPKQIAENGSSFKLYDPSTEDERIKSTGLFVIFKIRDSVMALQHEIQSKQQGLSASPDEVEYDSNFGIQSHFPFFESYQSEGFTAAFTVETYGSPPSDVNPPVVGNGDVTIDWSELEPTFDFSIFN